MKRYSAQFDKRHAAAGYTLLELVVASATAAVIVGGLTSSLFIAAQSLDTDTGSLPETRKANQALEIINRDLHSALSLSELTSTAITMTVPDRTGDNVPETVRYHWSGTIGDPIYQVYNGSSSTVVDDVQAFSFAWATRFIKGTISLPIILFVSGQAADGDGGLGTPTAAEQDRIDLMESWGYDVTVISQEATQPEFNAEFANANVIYVPATVNSGFLGSKLNDTTLGIVTESLANANALGFYSSLISFSGDQSTIYVSNNSHYITSSFAIGNLTIADSNLPIKWTNASLSPDATTLAVFSTLLQFPSMLILDGGDDLADASLAAGRRCQLPWGEGSFDVRELNTDGQLIMQRALEWAAGSGDDTATVEESIVFEEFTETQLSVNDTSITIALPPGTATDDLLIAAVATDGNRASSLAPPAGWSQVYVESETGDDVTLGVWWKLAGSSEASDFTFTWSGSERAYGWIMRFTGHNPANPIHAASTAGSSGATSSPTSPAVTTTVDNCMILRIGGFDDDDITVDDAGISGHTTITMDASNTTASASGGAAYVIQATAGDSGTANFTLTGSEEYRTVTIAIEPAP